MTEPGEGLEMKCKTMMKHIKENEFRDLREAIFAVEKRFPEYHPVRVALYRARVQVGEAMYANRENAGNPQAREVEDSEG